MEKYLNRFPQRPIQGLAQGIGRGEEGWADTLEAKSAVFLCSADVEMASPGRFLGMADLSEGSRRLFLGMADLSEGSRRLFLGISASAEPKKNARFDFLHPKTIKKP
jgi:hypothetical protein